MTRNINRGQIPSELGWIADFFDDVEERLRTLEAPDGNQLAQTVAALAELVANLQDYLDEYIATELPALVASEVASQLAAAFAGNITIGGSLTVGGAVTMPNIPGTTFVTEPRTVVWADTSNGRLGRT